MSDLLLLSNSANARGFLVHALPAIGEAIGGRRRAVFLPFAGVTFHWDLYAARVAGALAPLGMDISLLHQAEDPVAACQSAEIILVGGGNTFSLLHHTRRLGLLPAIRKAVAGGAVFIGWSAGSNLACPTIRTTNDMPVIDPGGFDALDLVPLQINPHYTNALPNGIFGETRNQRIAEFTRLWPTVPVLGLPEGNWLRVHGPRATQTLGGPHESWWFQGDAAPLSLPPGSTLPRVTQDTAR